MALSVTVALYALFTFLFQLITGIKISESSDYVIYAWFALGGGLAIISADIEKQYGCGISEMYYRMLSSEYYRDETKKILSLFGCESISLNMIAIILWNIPIVLYFTLKDSFERTAVSVFFVIAGILLFKREK